MDYRCRSLRCECLPHEAFPLDRHGFCTEVCWRDWMMTKVIGMDMNYSIIDDGNSECYDRIDELKKEMKDISKQLDRLDLDVIKFDVQQEFMWRIVQSHELWLERLRKGIYIICALLTLVAAMNVTAGRY